MESLTLSSPLSSSSLKSLHGHRSLAKLSSILPNKPFLSSLKCSQSSYNPTARFSSKTPFVQSSLNFSTDEFSFNPDNGLWASAAPQSPASAMRGAEADVMGLLFRERIVFLGCSIDDFVADCINSQLLLLDSQDPTRDIRLFINSSGGSLSATMAIFDVLRLVRADVSTIALGICASTASLILGGGAKGKRFAMPNTRIMIHQPLGGISGKVTLVETQAKELLNNKENVIRLVSGFTGRSNKQVEKDIEWDHYMSPIEAVEYGIIDGVIDRDSTIPLQPPPTKVKPSAFDSLEFIENPEKYLRPDIPDDEIY